MVHASCWFHCCQGDHLSLLKALPRPCCWLSKLRSNAKSWLNWVWGVDMFLQDAFGYCSRRKSLPPRQVAARKLQNVVSKLWPGLCRPFCYDSHDCLLWDTQIWRVCASTMSHFLMIFAILSNHQKAQASFIISLHSGNLPSGLSPFNAHSP